MFPEQRAKSNIIDLTPRGFDPKRFSGHRNVVLGPGNFCIVSFAMNTQGREQGERASEIIDHSEQDGMSKGKTRPYEVLQQ
jgi:hypothetical protein